MGTCRLELAAALLSTLYCLLSGSAVPDSL